MKKFLREKEYPALKRCGQGTAKLAKGAELHLGGQNRASKRGSQNLVQVKLWQVKSPPFKRYTETPLQALMRMFCTTYFATQFPHFRTIF